MAADAKAREKKGKNTKSSSSSSSSNISNSGSSNSTNGRVKTPMSSSVNASVERASRPKGQRPGVAVRSISILTRIFLWYALITVAFRCPSSSDLLSDEAPLICKPYLSGKEKIAPYTQPYYDAYLSHYVAAVRPHVDRINEKVVHPATDYVVTSYGTHGKPRVQQVQQLSQAQWEKYVKPQLEVAESWSRDRYETTLAPLAQKVLGAVRPYYDQTKMEMMIVHKHNILPAYKYALPRFDAAYQQGRRFTVNTALPFADWVGNRTIVYFSRIVWPRVQILYGENIEPQLARISQRLGRYRDSKKIQSVVSDVKSSADSSASSEHSEIVQSSAISESSSDASGEPSPSSSAKGSKSKQMSPEEKEEKEEKSKEKIAAASAVVNEDLKKWQEKFEKAAEDGVEDLKQRIKSITDEMVETQLNGTGRSYLIELEETTGPAFAQIQSEINTIAREFPEEYSEDAENTALEKLANTSRAAGAEVKSAAQKIRDWRGQFEAELASRVDEAASSTISVLMNIKEIGLQDMGMRWMYLEGVTHKDWKKFHEFKNRFDTWKKTVQKVAQNHEAVYEAKNQAEALETDAMHVASRAAVEIKRLREVARWKFRSKDTSDDFSNKKIPPPVAKAAASVSENVADAKEKASEDASSASAKVSFASEGDADRDAADKVAEDLGKAEEKAEGAKKKVFAGAAAQYVEAKQIVFEDKVDYDDSGYSDMVQSMASSLGDHASDLTNAISEAVYGTSSADGSVASVTSVAREQYENALSAASSVLYGTEQGHIESLSALGSEKYAQAVEAASCAIYGTPTPIASSLAAAASSQYDSATQAAKDQYDNAMSRLSEQISGTQKPKHEEMRSSIESAYSDSLHAASSRLENAFGSQTSTNPMAAISSIASSKLEVGISAASAQFSSAKAAYVPAATPTNQPYLVDAQRKYYEGLGIAHAQYSDFLSSASQAVYGTPTPTVESLLSAAQSQYSAALATASAKLAEVAGLSKSAYPGQDTLEAASERYNAAVLAASSSLSAASAAASSAVYGTSKGSLESASSAMKDQAGSVATAASSALYGTETPWTQAAASKASSNWEALVTKASEQIYGTPSTYTINVVSHASTYAAQATDAAAAQYSAVQALVSELVVGKEPDYTESVMSRLQSAYSTGVLAMASSASSYANDVYESASSVASSVFTPPPALETILDSVNEQIDSAVNAVSVQYYGSEKGNMEKATSAAADAYNSAQSKASSAAYGTEKSYAEAAQSSLASLASSAQMSISAAIYGTSTGIAEAAANTAAGVYSSMASSATENLAAATAAVGDGYEAAKAKISSAVYGPEQGAVESALSRLSAAVESGKAQLVELGQSSSEAVGDKVGEAKADMDDIAESVGSAVSSATERVRDEL